MSNLEQYQTVANQKGLTLLGKGSKPNYYLYKFNQCNHENEFVPAKLKNNNPICKICQFKKFAEEAQQQNMTIISYGSKSSYYLYKFNDCNHEVEYKPTDLRTFKPTCKICQLQNYKNDAQARGLTLIKESSKSGFYHYTFDKCGHESILKPSKVKINQPTCQTCGEGHLTCQSNFYILTIKNKETNHSFIKVGIANNLEQRVKDYKLSEGYEHNKELVISLKNKIVAQQFEKKFEKIIKQFKLDKNFMQTIMKSGYTECYPIELLSFIKEQFNQFTLQLK